MDVPAGIAMNDYLAGLHPGAPPLWNFCQSCLKLFKDLIAKVLQASNISISVKPYYDPLTRHLDNNLIRLEIWIFDTGLDDKDLRQASMSASSDTKLERCVTSILEDIISQLRVIGELVERMRTIASAMLKAPNENLKQNHQLDKGLKEAVHSCEHIASAVNDLIGRTEAVRMYLATQYKCGPLAGFREQIRRTRDQVPVTVDLSEEEPSEEEDPWTRKNLLTLDGGGVRNYSTLLILKHLMSCIAAVEQNGLPSAGSSAFPSVLRPHRLGIHTRRAHREYFPCHYFDYIAGSGFGGILAIMLGRLRMTADECLEAYELLLERVFSSRRMRHKLLPKAVAIASGGVRYDHKPLELELRKMTEPRVSRLDPFFQQLDEDMCRTIVVAWPKLGETWKQVPYLFRSYYHPKTFPEDILERNPGRSEDHEIWQVGRATSATPRYFESMRLEERAGMSEYFDASSFNNNPSVEAYRSVNQVHHNDLQTVKVLVSIGSGRQLEEEPAFSSVNKGYDKDFSQAAKQSEKTHLEMEDAAMNRTDYFRLDVQHGLESLGFDEWKGKKGGKTLDMIRIKTAEYLASGHVDLTKIAKKLVAIRRQRSTWKPELDRWERFCYGVEYACLERTCMSHIKKFKFRQSLRDHVKATHSIEPDELEAFLDAGKRFPLDDDLE